ncbi:MAG: DUF4163 domain-containing protein, partial [Pricia sp.]|nr:DUF4163 domain-containing protein [Pricia sp.]
MKFQPTYVLLFLFLIGCQKNERLTFEPLDLDETRCSECPKVAIHIPHAIENSKTANTINDALKEEIIEILNYDEEVEATTIKEAVRSFSEGYWELKQLYPEEATTWEAKIEGKVTFEDPALLTIELNTYLFTGGAHGYSSKRFLNFDKRKGRELENWQLFRNRE